MHYDHYPVYEFKTCFTLSCFAAFACSAQQKSEATTKRNVKTTNQVNGHGNGCTCQRSKTGAHNTVKLER